MESNNCSSPITCVLSPLLPLPSLRASSGPGVPAHPSSYSNVFLLCTHTHTHTRTNLLLYPLKGRCTAETDHLRCFHFTLQDFPISVCAHGDTGCRRISTATRTHAFTVPNSWSLVLLYVDPSRASLSVAVAQVERRLTGCGDSYFLFGFSAPVGS